MEIAIGVIGILLFALYLQVDLLVRHINHLNRIIKNERAKNND